MKKSSHLGQRKINTKIGPLYLLASEKGLAGVLWKEQPGSMTGVFSPSIKNILKSTEQQLTEYLLGHRQEFDLPLDVEGTEFQKKVWQELSRIPYGKTCSYKDIALLLKDKNASRAVGTANGRNPISIIVPCHRVISSDGTLGGYAGGLNIKTQLLALEKAPR